jgi:hypothetical protein
VTGENGDNVRGAAYHEAAHAVVGSLLGWVVMEVDISCGGGEGRTCFYRKCDLSFRDRTAICCAGMVGQEMFKAATHRGAGNADRTEIAVLLTGLDETTSAAIRGAGKRLAHDFLVEQRANVERVAEHLIAYRTMDQRQFTQVFTQPDKR